MLNAETMFVIMFDTTAKQLLYGKGSERESSSKERASLQINDYSQ